MSAADSRNVSALQAGRIARTLGDRTRDGLRRWAHKKPGGVATALGAVLERRDSGTRTLFVAQASFSYRVDRDTILNVRTVETLERRGLVARRLLWLELTPTGAQVAQWIAGLDDVNGVVRVEDDRRMLPIGGGL